MTTKKANLIATSLKLEQEIHDLKHLNVSLIDQNIELLHEIKCLKVSKLNLSENQKDALSYLEGYYERSPSENIKDMQLNIQKMYIWATEGRSFINSTDDTILEMSELVQDLVEHVTCLHELFEDGLPLQED